MHMMSRADTHRDDGLPARTFLASAAIVLIADMYSGDPSTLTMSTVVPFRNLMATVLKHLVKNFSL